MDGSKVGFLLQEKYYWKTKLHEREFLPFIFKVIYSKYFKAMIKFILFCAFMQYN